MGDVAAVGHRFCANLIGPFAVASLFVVTSALPPDLLPALGELSYHATSMRAREGFWRGIPAGVIIALIVWMLPQAESAKFFLIMDFT
jgi:formate/nitrite transporter FocA (FNT family)